MKKVLISGIFILTAFCLQGQIVNSGFESGTITPQGINYLLDGWMFAFNDKGGAAVPSFDTINTYTGARSFKAVVTYQGVNTNPWNIRLDMTDDDFLSFTKDDYVEFSFYAKANTNNRNLSVKFRDSDNGNWIQQLKSLSTEFEQYTIGQFITESRDDYKLSFFLAADTGTFWIDEVSVTVESNTIDEVPMVYHVAPDGDDTNPGTLEAPFESLEKASFVINGNDSLYLHEGIYRGVLNLNFKNGDENNPVTIRSWPGDQVIIDGTMDVIDGWELHEGNIYKVQLDQDIWGLYYNDSMMMAARWPNASIYDYNFFNQKETYRDISAQSFIGGVYDTRPTNNETSEYYDFPTDGRYGYIRPGFNTATLAGSGVSMEGAIAIMNLGSWMTWASAITKHDTGSSYFEYDTMFTASGSTRNAALKWTRPQIDYITPTTTVEVNRVQEWIEKNHCHYYIEGLQCLDAPGEWWYTPEDKTLFFYPPDGQDPNGKTVKLKVRDYSIKGKFSEYVTIKDIDFYATGFYFESCLNMTIKNCNFLFPGHSRRVLGDHDRPAICTFNNKNEQANTSHKIINCRFEYFDGDGVEFIDGKYNIIDNVLLHDFNFSCIGSGMAMRTSKYDTIRRVTFYNAGGSEGIQVKDGGVAEFNHMHHYGSLQHDGAGLQTFFKEAPVTYRYNWSHSTLKGGMRFDDGGGLPQPPSYSGQMSHNVSWTSRGFQIKGDSNLVNNNLLFNTRNGLELMVSEKMNGINTNSIAINNMADWILNTGYNRGDAPGYLGSNIRVGADSLKKWLRDPDNRDFRPMYDDFTRDRGEDFYVCSKGDSPTGFCFNYNRPLLANGQSPDIGPYETGTENYWIPGYRYPHASTPVPLDGGTSHAEFVDLMWLKGYQAESSDVYFGTSAAEVESATRSSEEYKGSQVHNIFYPGALVAGQSYYWRIDAVKAGETVKGEVWSFSAGRDANPPAHTIEFKVFGQSPDDTIPLQGTVISLNSRSIISDENGEGKLKMIKPDNYSYSLFRKGYKAEERVLVIQSDSVIMDTLDFTTFDVSVEIKDEDTGKPVTGCEIGFNGEMLVSDEEGKVHLSEIEYGWYGISATAGDYLPAVFGDTEIFSDTNLVFTLVRDYREVSVTVVNRVSGDPLNRAEIRYDDQFDVTNSSGVASLDKVLKGYWLYSIEHDDYFTLTDSVLVLNDTALVISMTNRRANIQFEINDSAGPLSGIPVVLSGFQGISDDDGIILFFNQPARQKYGYEIDKEGYLFVSDSLYLEIDTTVTILLELETGISNPWGPDVKIFPNPASDDLLINLPFDEAEMRLVNQEGKLIYLNNIYRGINNINVFSLKDGIYYLSIHGSGTWLSYKIVIQH